MAEAVKRKAKDTVFTNLFKRKEYVFELYRALHPEDTAARQSDIEIVTINNVLINDIYNDLGFTVGGRLIVLVEAQSTWTENIVVRVFMYLAKTYKDYCDGKRYDLYGTKKVHLPKPELYVIYTGSRVERPAEISLSESFFGGEQAAVEVKVKMLYGEGGSDIVSQYVTFTKVLDEQVREHGRTREAIANTLKICMDKRVLKSYLMEHETEVTDIMVKLFDEKIAFGNYIYNLTKEISADSFSKGQRKGEEIGRTQGMAQGAAQCKAQMVADMLRKGASADFVASVSGYTQEEVKGIAATL